MAPFYPNAPTWLTASAKKTGRKKKQQQQKQQQVIANSPDVKMPTPDSKPNPSVSVSAKKKKNKNRNKKKAAKPRAAGDDLADDEQPSDVSGFIEAPQSPTLSAKDEVTFVTVEEFEPEEDHMVKIKQEPASPTFPKATVFQQAVVPEDSFMDEHFSTPLQSPAPPPNTEVTKKENAPPLHPESHIPPPSYPHYEPPKRSASPSPSSQLRMENPAALASLFTSINDSNVKKQSPSKTTKSMQQFLKTLTPTVPNSTQDNKFPPTSPLNTKTPLGQLPNRMLQFDSSPANRFSPNKSENKCTPVPLPATATKGFLAALKLGTPIRATAGTAEDPLTPADIDVLLASVGKSIKSNSDDESDFADFKMPDADEHAIAKPEETNVEMATTIKSEQHDGSVVEASSKKATKKSKKDKKRRLEESNAMDEDDTITVSTAKKAKKSKKNKKVKTADVEEDKHQDENAMELDGPTEVEDTTVVGENTQLEVDMQLDTEATQLVRSEHAAAFETPAAPEAPEQDPAEMVVDEPASAVKKKKTKKSSKKGKKAQVLVEEPQVAQDDEEVTNLIHALITEPATDAPASPKSSPAPETKSTKKGREAKEVPAELEPEEPEQDDTHPIIPASDVAASMAENPFLSVAKHFVKLENTLSFHTETSQGELATVKQHLASLEQRVEANELRASIRHEILFNAMKKVLTDLHTLGTLVCTLPIDKRPDSHKDHRERDPYSVESSPDERERDRLARSVRAATVAPSYVQSVTPVPLPKNRAISSHHGGRVTPGSGVGAGAKATGAGAGAKAAADTAKSGTGTASDNMGRKNQEKLLKGFTAEMDAAKDAKAVEIKGRLVVKYADDLFKML